MTSWVVNGVLFTVGMVLRGLCWFGCHDYVVGCYGRRFCLKCGHREPKA